MIDALTLDQVLERCADAIRSRRRLLVGVVNAAKIINLRGDRLLRESLLECDIIVADGQSVVWASRLLRRPLPERVAGIDIFESLLGLADRERYAVFLLGARPEVLEHLLDVVHDRFPGARVVGSKDGYFTDDQAPEIAEAIRDSGADMLFLGMVSPKKEIFLGSFGDDLQVPVMHGVGGSFDVLAGVTQRAPLSWQRLGLEWAFRLKQEPGRLWRRYLRTNSRFIAQVVLELIRPTPTWKPIDRESEGMD